MLAGRRGAHQLAVVRATDREAGCDVVALGELLVDRDAKAAEGIAIPLDHLREAVGTANLLRVQDVVRRDDLVERVEVPLRCVLEERADGRLGAAAQVQLGEDVGDVMLGSAPADVEALGDLRVGAARRKQRKNLRLPLCERAVALRPYSPAGAELAQQAGRRVYVSGRTDALERPKCETRLGDRRFRRSRGNRPGQPTMLACPGQERDEDR